MEFEAVEKITDLTWQVAPTGSMQVPVVVVADAPLIADMDDKVLEQARNVASLPGIVRASYVMPDGHWGYGFPIGGVAAFDADAGGVVSAGGVGLDIACGVRCLLTGLEVEEVQAVDRRLAEALFRRIPAGMGSTGRVRLRDHDREAMLRGGAAWAIEEGWGRPEDLERIEERGCIAGAEPQYVSTRARLRQRDEMGTLGSGSHYLEVQRITEIFAPDIAHRLGLFLDDVVVSIHCGSRGLGHQIGTDYLREMGRAAESFGLRLPDRELASAPIHSELGQRYLGAMRAGSNCALANRQILTEMTRQIFAEVLPDADLQLLYDVSHNTCREEEHLIDGTRRKLFVHRKGATRALGPGHPSLPPSLRDVGQPVLIGGTMGTESHVLIGTSDGMAIAFGSAPHGAGRKMSRHEAARIWRGTNLVDELGDQGILVRAVGMRGIAEEAPGAYKDVGAVVEAAHRAGLARKVARLEPLICIKG